MKYSDLDIGLKLEIQLFGNDGMKMNLCFVSELEWVEEKDILFIASPIYEGKLYPIHNGTLIAVSFTKNKDFFEFTAKVIGRENRDNLAMLKIQAISSIIKIQRREFFRFEVNLPVKFRVIESVNMKCDQEYIETVTRDLSGGGLCMRLKEPIEIGKYLECELNLPDKIKFIGKVVRFTQYERMQGAYKYEIGVSFVRIDEVMREKVISYIFQEQRRLLKKG